MRRLVKSRKLVKEEEEMVLKGVEMKKEEVLGLGELLRENKGEEKRRWVLKIIGEEWKENVFRGVGG